MQPLDVNEAFVEASLKSVSVNVLMYALGIAIKLAWSHFSLMEGETNPTHHCFPKVVENNLKGLLENEFDRVKLSASMLLHSISQGSEQVSL